MSDYVRTLSSVDNAPPTDSRRALRGSLGVLAGYLVVGLWLWRNLIPHLGTHALQRGEGDSAIFIWWLKWVPFAIAHGHDPFYSTYLQAPHGVSAMWNTSVLPLGALFAPITVLFGPVVSFNVAAILGPPLSAWTCSLWLRRYASLAGAALGGLVFGFSPFVLGQASGSHLHMTWLVLLPLIVMLVEDITWRSPQAWRRKAPMLGLLVSIQLLVSSEALLITGMGCVGVVLLLAVRNPKVAIQDLPAVARSAGIALAVALAVSAWPLVEQFRGGRAPTAPIRDFSVLGARLTSFVTAPTTLMFHPAHGSGYGHLTYIEDGSYVGWPLLVLVIAAVLFIRRRGIGIAAAAIVASVIFQMHGKHWTFVGMRIPSPVQFMYEHVRAAGNLVPPRFSLLMWFAVAWILAVTVDEATIRLRVHRVMPILAAAACLIPLLPGPMPATDHVIATPPFFTSKLRDAIPNGSIVMVAPIPTPTTDMAQFWQSEADMRFRQFGGYMIHPARGTGAATFYADDTTLTRLFELGGWFSTPYAGDVTPALIREARAELEEAKVTMLVVGPSPYGEKRHLQIAEALLGRPPDHVTGGVAVWDLRRADGQKPAS